MNMSNMVVRIGMSMWIALLLTAVAVPAESASASAALDNLIKAYDSESAARAQCVAFAQKADEEGYAKAASLFRASARSLEVRLQHFKRVISKMGGVPKADIPKVEARSTRENLELAMKEEADRNGALYPAFVKQAKEEGAKGAVKTFNGAMRIGTGRSALYGDALKRLEEMKGDAAEYYVCPVCGYLTDSGLFKKCPVCWTPRSKFEAIR